MDVGVNVSLMWAVKEYQKCCMKPLQSLFFSLWLAPSAARRSRPLFFAFVPVGFHGKRETDCNQDSLKSGLLDLYDKPIHLHWCIASKSASKAENFHTQIWLTSSKMLARATICWIITKYLKSTAWKMPIKNGIHKITMLSVYHCYIEFITLIVGAGKLLGKRKLNHS